MNGAKLLPPFALIHGRKFHVTTKPAFLHSWYITTTAIIEKK
jgi:hypothetical protein